VGVHFKYGLANFMGKDGCRGERKEVEAKKFEHGHQSRGGASGVAYAAYYAAECPITKISPPIIADH
jgi:hypothetical protein